MPVAMALAVVAIALPLFDAGSAGATFGFRDTEFKIVNEDQTPDVLAGSHPFEMTAGFAFITRENLRQEAVPDGDPKDVQVELPAGLVGNPSATPKCSAKDFHTVQAAPTNIFEHSSCPGDTQVGVARTALFVFGGNTATVFSFAVYNLVPPPGVPAEIGFNPLGLAITLLPNVHVHSGHGDGGYSLITDVDNISQYQPLSFASVALWGVPGEHSHDKYRGHCMNAGGESVCEEASSAGAEPFLRMPTSCTDGALAAVFGAEPWPRPSPVEPGVLEPNVFVEEGALDPGPAGQPAALSGCGRLDFNPSLTVRPQGESANSPTAVSVDLHTPQNESPSGLGEADLKGATVSLPPGLTVNPSAADGLAACSQAQIDLASTNEAACPDASKIGSVEVVTPLLEAPLQGAVYQAEQGNNNPFGSLLAFYIVAHGDGVTVKLPGEVTANPATGQLTTTVREAPQLPFGDFKLNFFGGPRAALLTPAACGEYAASASFEPWSGAPAVSPAIQPFTITGDCGGGFAPSFTAQTISNQAGGFSPFSTTIARTDQDQDLGQISVRTPPGLLGMLSKVSLCEEPLAATGACPSASRIGHVTVGAGSGPDQLFLPQAGRQEDPVYLTGPYRGAPFGLSILVHAEAGPLNLGPVPVRAAIYIDPHTAQLTVVSDPLPRILQGIPLDVRTVNVSVDRSEFTFNPTDCEPLSVTGTIASTRGASANVSAPFQAANCASLSFHPKFTVSTAGHTAKSIGASLDVKVASGPGQANIGRVLVALPKKLPARLTTLQKACTEATFAANPATCPAASLVGLAKAVTPVLGAPLTGPAYLVSHGGAAFPDLVVILQGEGIELDLVGNTNIKKGITTSTFASVPDAPITSFELKLPQGPHSALTTDLPAKAKGSLCSTKLAMPTTIDGQNGARVTQSTRIALTGCATGAAARAGGGRRK